MATRYDNDELIQFDNDNIQLVPGETDRRESVYGVNMKIGRNFVPVHLLQVKYGVAVCDPVQATKDVSALMRANAGDTLASLIKGAIPYSAQLGARCFVSANSVGAAECATQAQAKYSSAVDIGRKLNKLDVAGICTAAKAQAAANAAAETVGDTASLLSDDSLAATIARLQAEQTRRSSK